MKMKTVLAVVALFVTVEVKAYQGWGNGPGLSNHPGRVLPWLQTQQNYQNDRFGPEVEWICHSPKTNDMMVIAADNARQNSGRGPWWQGQNHPPGHQRHNQNWHYLTRPIVIVQQESTGTDADNDGSQMPVPFPTTPKTHNNNNNDNELQTTPGNHGGEGLIDVRIGE